MNTRKTPSAYFVIAKNGVLCVHYVMSELRDFSHNDIDAASAELWGHELSDDPVITNAHEMAKIAELCINESVDRTGEVDTTLLRKMIDELDVKSRHFGEELRVSGSVIVQRGDFTQVTKDENGKSSLPREAIQARTEYVDNLLVQSLGYFALRKEDGFRIAHLTQAEATCDARIQAVGASFSQQQYLIPTDDTVHITRANRPYLNTAEILSAYHPDIIDDVDAAIFNGETRTQQLRQLSRVDLQELNGAAHETLSQYLTQYINKTMEFSLVAPYRVSGVRQAFFEGAGGVFNYISLKPGTKLVGTVSGINLLSTTMDPNLLTLDMSIPSYDNRYRRAKIPLSGRMYLTELPTFSPDHLDPQ